MTLIQTERGLISQKILRKNVVNFFSHFEYRLTNKKNEVEKPDPEAKIRKYIDGLGSDANAGERADFVSACYDALRDDGDMELQQQF